MMEFSAPCPLCRAADWQYLFRDHGQALYQCRACGWIRRPQANGGLPPAQSAQAPVWTALEDYLGRAGIAPGRVEIAGAASEALSAGLAARGWTVAAADDPLPRDLLLIDGALEGQGDPAAWLLARRAALRTGGAVCILAADAAPVAAGRANWGFLNPARAHGLTRETLESLLYATGFEAAEATASGRLLGFGLKTEAPAPLERRHTLSLIMPVFNEASTVADVMAQVFDKRIDGCDIEIIVIESNSTDGSRAIVERLVAGRPNVTLILEDRPRGKGHAVRAGLARARGDYILIQDADLEYDINDYETLLEPLMHYRRAYVLGSRHHGSVFKIRTYDKTPVVGFITNLAHFGLTMFFNILYGQSSRDIFTMYKVFRRDCIRNLPLECNRFDFDNELASKLVRRGYTPLEIPVNYTSRSFQEGKKISFFRDPPTWIKAFLKYRWQRLPGKV